MNSRRCVRSGVRLALATINPTIGDLAGNAKLIAAAAERARDADADCVLLPELALSGYPPKDLLLQEGFVAACAREAKRAGETAGKGLTLVFGTPLPVDQSQPEHGCANSLVVFRDGAYVDYYDKRLLPTYDVFDENRYFEPGSRAVVVDVKGVRVGLSICEDLWRGEDAGVALRYRSSADPMRALVETGASVILSASASPFALGKGVKHREILRTHAQRHNVWVASVNQLGGNDELIFDGHRYAYAPGGELAAAGALFGDDLVVVDIPGNARAPLPPEDDCGLLYHALVAGVRDYLRKTGFRRALIGLSGGIDSALTYVLACAAIGRENVLGVAMPGPYSSTHSVEDALALAANVGGECRVAPIGHSFEAMRTQLDKSFDEIGAKRLGASMPDLTEENLQSRLRGTTLMAISNRTGAIVLTTGNKSEMAVGYATLYGDMNGGLAVLIDVGKQQVYALSRWINEHAGELGFERPPIPARTIEKPPSAELRPNQTDQDSLPPYDVLDAIIDLYVEQRRSPASIVQSTGYDAALVARVARMIDLAEFKRKQAAVGLKVTSVAFGAGRRWPIAQGWRPQAS